MQQDVQDERRDITIIYRQLKIQTSVEMNKIVGEFFKHQLKNFANEFNQLAQQAKTPSFVPLSGLKNYAVTLNTTVFNQNSILNSGISFGNYDKKKTLRFYVHDLQSNNNNLQADNEKSIVFCLYRSNMVEREQSVDISDMRFEQFQKKMREIFNIDHTMPIKYKNMKDNTFISLAHATAKPIAIINQLRLPKVGIYPVYEAGGM